MRIIAFLQLFPPLLYLFALAHKGGSIHAQAAGGVPYIAVAAVRPPDVADLQLLHQPVQVHLLKVLLSFWLMVMLSVMGSSSGWMTFFLEIIIMRSTTLCSSRILPGQL